MIRFINPGILFLMGILFLTFSKSKRYYQKSVEDNGERFANQVIKGLKICGYSLSGIALLWSVIIFLGK